MIKHLVITRFSNTPFGYDDHTLLDLKRLHKKTDMFLATCYKSMRFQTNQNFEHVLLIHPQCPDAIVRRLEKLKVSIVSHITSPTAYVKSVKLNDVKYLITTRIDDDDLVCKSAIDRIQNFNNMSIGVTGFKNGVTLDYGTKTPFAFNWESEKGMLAIGMSLIQNLSVFPEVIYSVYSTSHASFKDLISKTYPDFQWNHITEDEPLYIYTRHDMSDSFRLGRRSHSSKNVYDYNKLAQLFDLN